MHQQPIEKTPFVLILCLATWPVLAADYAQSVGGPGDNHVNNADANGDGVVSLYELRAAYYADPEFNRKIEQTFKQYDVDGDGMISSRERSLAAQGRASAIVAPARPAAQPIAPTDVEAKITPPAPVRYRSDPAPAPVTARQSAAPGRSESWLQEVDVDRSGGASESELQASGPGQHWLSTREFKAADRDESGELNAKELNALIQILERRQR